MAWYDFILNAAKSVGDTIGDALISTGEALQSEVPKTERKRSREVRKEKRSVKRQHRKRARRQRKRPSAPVIPGQPKGGPPGSPVRGKEGGGWRLIAGNPDIVSPEFERGSYPTLALGMAAYEDALQSLGTESMVALVHWLRGSQPYVLYVGYPG